MSSSSSLFPIKHRRTQTWTTDKDAIFEYALSKRPQLNFVISVAAGWYFENFGNENAGDLWGGFPHHASTSPEVKKKHGENTLVLRAPKWGGREDIPLIDITNDYGDIVHAVFLEPGAWNGKSIQAVSDIRSWSEVVQAFQKGMSYRFVRHLLRLRFFFVPCTTKKEWKKWLDENHS